MKFAQVVGKLFRNHVQENKFTQKNFGEIIHNYMYGNACLND